MSADLRGISKSEFLGRVAEAEQFCNYSPDNVSFEELKKDAARVDACQAAVSWGVTPSVYKIRYSLTEKICKETGGLLGRKSEAYRSCYRDVMSGKVR